MDWEWTKCHWPKWLLDGRSGFGRNGYWLKWVWTKPVLAEVVNLDEVGLDEMVMDHVDGVAMNEMERNGDSPFRSS